MKKKEETGYDAIVRDINAGKYAPVYFLMGEEDYYIDRLSEYIVEKALTEEEKDFNMDVFFGQDTDIAVVVETAKRYPMMAERRVVVVKEAQNLKSLESLVPYLQRLMKSTVLVFCYKHGCLDRRKKLAAEIEKAGVLFESKKLKDWQLPQFAMSYVKSKGTGKKLVEQAAEILCESVGSDLSRLASELDKLLSCMGKYDVYINAKMIEQNIGISREFNNFELRSALVAKDVVKANRIAKYFADNPRQNPLVVTVSVLFSYFSNLMVAYQSPSKTESGIAEHLGLRSTWQAREYLAGLGAFRYEKLREIISALRECDAKSKGIGYPATADGELLRELVYRIIH